MYFQKTLLFFLLLIVNIGFAQVCSNPPDKLQTRPDEVPILNPSNSGFKSVNTFSLEISSKLVDLRSDAQIVMNPNVSTCNYPGAFWSRSSSNATCTETWNGSFDWATFRSDCGAVRTEDADFIYFDGEITVTQIDTLGVIRGKAVTREVITGIRYKIVFPKKYTLSSPTIQVFAPVNVIAAVTKQDFDGDKKRGLLDLFTSVQYPFVLTNGGSSVDRPEMNVSIPSFVANCPPNLPCEITFNFEVDPKTLCFLNGKYNLTFDLACSPSFNGSCPLQGEKGVITFDIASEDLCGTFIENVDLSGTLNPYQADYATLKTAFLIGQPVYWRFDVNSNKVSITNTQLLDVKSNFNSTNDLYLLQNQTISNLGTNVQFALDGNGGLGTQARFKYNILNSLYPVPEDQFLPAIITATVAVTYQNTQKRSVTSLLRNVPMFSKRQVELPAKAQKFSSQKKIELQNSVVADSKSSFSSESKANPQPAEPSKEDTGISVIYIGIVIGALVACCIAIAIVGFLIYRKKKSNNSPSSSSSQTNSSNENRQDLI